MKWSDITLAQFQQIEAVNAKVIPAIDKVLFSVCIVYGLTEFELDNEKPAKVLKMATSVSKVFESPFLPKPETKIGRYFINYDASTMTFGQYIELAFFLQQPLKYAHYTMATISRQWGRKHVTSEHRKKAEYFINQPVTKIMGGIELIKKRFQQFNTEYKELFGVHKEVAGDVDNDQFIKRHGWIYSATQVAVHEGKPLDDIYALPVRQALNDLVFLKAKGKYEVEQLKKNKPVT